MPRHERSRRTAELLAAASRPESEQRSHDLHDEVLMMNIGVAYALARRFARRGVDLQDLEQVACEALVKAVKRFDPSQDHDFLSFAVPTIRGELQRHFRDLGWMVRPTRKVQETQWRAARAEDDLTTRLGRRPDREELVAELGITREEYVEAQSAHGCFRPTSLDKPLTTEGDGDGFGASLPSDDRGPAECEARLMVMPAVRRLSERERRVLYLRFFLDYTQAEIGAEIGVGQAQVSRIINQALAELQQMLTGSAREAT
jgi:RNA polymerase sigma-B factor